MSQHPAVRPRSFAKPVESEDELRQHITGTYFGLRAGMAVVGFLLPIGLVFLGLVLEPTVGVRSSLSAYYNSAGLRDVFVGALVVVGALLIVYRGFSVAEDRAFNFAGLFAFVVALVPTGNPPHGVAAVALFGCMAYVSWFRAQDTLHLLPLAEQRTYATLYKTLAVLMVVLPL